MTELGLLTRDLNTSLREGLTIFQMPSRRRTASSEKGLRPRNLVPFAFRPLIHETSPGSWSRTQAAVVFKYDHSEYKRLEDTGRG